MRAIILGAVLGLAALSAQAAVYKWVDQNGKTHYSDKPVQNAEQVKVGPGAKAGSEEEQEGEEGAAKKTDQPKDESDAHREARAQKCDQARQRLTDYQDSSGLYVKDEFGQQRQLSPEEQVQAIVDMQKNVDSFCAGMPEPEPAGETEEVASPENL